MSAGRYFFGSDFGAEAAFFCAFCFFVLEVFFGLLSPMAQSFLKVHPFVASILTHQPCSSNAATPSSRQHHR